MGGHCLAGRVCFLSREVYGFPFPGKMVNRVAIGMHRVPKLLYQLKPFLTSHVAPGDTVTP